MNYHFETNRFRFVEGVAHADPPLIAHPDGQLSQGRSNFRSYASGLQDYIRRLAGQSLAASCDSELDFRCRATSIQRQRETTSPRRH